MKKSILLAIALASLGAQGSSAQSTGLSGTGTLEATGLRLRHPRGEIFDSLGGWVDSGSGDVDGNCSVELPPGTYFGADPQLRAEDIVFVDTIESADTSAWSSAAAASSQLYLPWFDKIQLLQFGRGYNINSSPILSKAPFTGSGWGIYFPSGWDTYTIKSEVAAWHSRNAIYIPATSATRLLNNDINYIPDSHRLVDLDGNYINRPPDTRHYTIFSPIWKTLLVNAIQSAIDLGADGIQIDDVLFPDVIFSSASFDSLTMSAFRQYLETHYSEAELANNFGIDSLETFHYGEWINAHGLQSTWNQLPLQGLAGEFYKFLIFETKSFIHEIAEYAHSYAFDNYGKQFTVSCNPNFVANGYFLLDEVDYLLAQHHPFQPSSPFAHTDIKAMKGVKNWPVVVLPEPNKEKLPTATQNMIKLIIADIYSAGGAMAFGEALTEGLGMPISIDLDIFGKYMTFILSHSFLYENLALEPEVALLNSMASRNAQHWRLEGDVHLDWQNALRGSGLLLANSNIQFDVIFAPDSRFTTIPSFTVEDLQRYEVVVLPHSFALTNDQAQTLLDYVHDGGIIVALGDIGTNNPDGTLANRPTLLSLQQDDGVKDFGAGKFVYNSTSLGEAYLWDWGIPHETVRQRFQSMILPYITQKVKTNKVSQVHRPGGATGFLYQDPHGNYIVHLVNYDYDEYSDVFAAKEDIALSILADTTKTWEAVYVSPDFLGQHVLMTTNDSGYVSMTIPQLEAYGIIILQENQIAPQIVSRTPETNVTIVGGDSLRLSVEAIDPDGNPLFFQWYVNGEVDSLAAGSTYLLRTTHESSGIDTVTVEISDGSQMISTYWLVTIQPYVFPKILFDESHNERNTISLSRAQLLNPAHPDWIYFGILQSKMDTDYITHRFETGVLSDSLLQDYHVLILAAPNDNLSPLEISNIVSFVSSGGGLIFLGDAGLDQNIDSLLQSFGVQFEQHVIFEPAPPGEDGGNTIVYNFANHASLGTHPQFVMNWGGSLSVLSPAIALGFSDGTTWREMDWDGEYDTNEPKGPFTIVAASEYQTGRIFCVSDNAFHDDYLQWGPSRNDDLFLDALKWLTEAVNKVPSQCLASDTDLCLNNYRFKVEAKWRDFQGKAGEARAHPLSTDSGYFTFFSEDNAEVFIKVLDACAIAGTYWVFNTHLSNVEYTITITDTQTGQTRTIYNPLGCTAPSILATTTIFTECGGGEGVGLAETEFIDTSELPPNSEPVVEEYVDATVTGTCSVNEDTMCLNRGRFRLHATFRDFQGGGGVAKMWPLSSDSGYATFFDDSNVEVFMKVLDACAFGRYWVFVGGLTNVGVELYVEDTVTGKVWHLTNPSGSTFATALDTQTFFTDCGM